MKTRKNIVASFRKITPLVSICIASAVMLFGWTAIARLQPVDNQIGAKPDKQSSVRAKRRGFPNLNLDDGIELSTGDSVNSGVNGKLMASADFDSDGTADLVVADMAGNAKLYHGNSESKRSGMLMVQGIEVSLPFTSTGAVFSLGFSPDFLETGDFNGDGRKDILATAKGATSVELLTGNGDGSFLSPRKIVINGFVSAFAVGEIGLMDGQADLAIAVTNKNGSQLLVFEHPESAFKYKPEVFHLSSTATAIAIGDLNGDHYSDVAVGGGRNLTVISERGQAYPWDILKESGIKRPAAIVEQRQMPSTVEGLAIGNFSGERAKSLAILSGNDILRLKPLKTVNWATHYFAKSEAPKFLPVDVDSANVGTLPEPVVSTSASDPGGALLVDGRATNGDKQNALLNQFMEKAKQYAALEPSEKLRLVSERAASAGSKSEIAKQGFLNTISSRPSNLAAWDLETLVSDARLSANSASTKSLLHARASASGSDDLILAGATVNIFTQPKDENGIMRSEVVSLETGAPTQAVLPMRINGDAMDDLVVLPAGSDIPSVMQSAPTAVILVNIADDVNTACDGVGECSLRTAITQANTQPGSLIAILIPGAGVHTITPLSQLPVIRANGTRLAGATDVNTGAKLVEITGGQAGVADGIKVRASSCSVSDLVINNFQGFTDPNTGSTTGSNSITIESTSLSPNSSNNLISGNYLGTDSTGTIARNGGTGVLIFDADANDIIANLMSGLGNGALNGIGLDITAGNNNYILGNVIGTTSNGDVRLQNGTGVFLSGSNNQFGGDGPGEGNVVSGNGTDRQPGNPNYPGCDGDGIIVAPLVDLDTGLLLTEFNSFKGNRLGTSADGTQPIGNCGRAIGTTPQTATNIGSITHSGRNIISGNGLDAIYCGFPGSPYSEGGYCAIAGNNIGTDITGTLSIPNSIDNVHSGLGFTTGTVLIVNSDTYSYFGSPGGTTPGGECTGFCNLLSGQYTTTHFAQNASFLRFGWGIVGAFNNFVGTDRTGTQSLPNTVGISMGGATYDPSTSYIGGYGTDGNGGDVSLGNLMSGNKGSAAVCGAYIFGIANCNVYNNLIGPDTTGTNILPNGEFAEAGVIVTNGFGRITIGYSDPLARNVISGNHNSGIGLRNFGGDLLVSNNFIGVNKLGSPLGNEANGIFDYFGGAIIGGSPADANIIANNSGAGVLIPNPFGNIGFVASGVNISQNKIKDNGGPGIDLSPTSLADGVTENDCVDHDDGPNELQNYPVMIAPVFNGDGTVTVSGSLVSEIVKPHRLDFYSNTASDPTNYGEGDSYIGSISVTTNGNGFVAFTTTSTGAVPSGSFITATATNPNGSTSEFSCAAGLCTPAGATAADITEPSLICVDPIIVNVTTDDADSDTADGQCDIDTNLPGLQCSLRAAIQEANLRYSLGQGKQDITFNIPGSGVQTITPASVLPDITSQVTINGASQTGYNSTPLIELNGINTPFGSTGLRVTGNGSAEIRALIINRFGAGTGIWLEGVGGSKILACFIGTNSAGTAQLGTMVNGIMINDSPNNFIGVGPNETAAYARNILAGSAFANVTLQGASSQHNNVVGNYYDLALDGVTGLPNASGGGIAVINDAQNNMIGGLLTDADHVNYLGNEVIGILLGDGASSNTVVDNVVLNSRVGVAVVRASNNRIGIDIGRKNVIGNTHVGIYLGNSNPPIGSSSPIGDSRLDEPQRAVEVDPSSLIYQYGSELSASQRPPLPDRPQANATGNTFQGNHVGSSPTGIQIPNDYGIVVREASGNLIGGETDLKNLISFNTIYGVLLDAGADNNTLQRNFIGVGVTGAAAPNGKGVGIVGSNNQLSHNFISGNTSDGVRIFADPGDPQPNGNVLSNINLIGTTVSGTAALPNGGYGVVIEAGTGNKIGGNMRKEGNLVSGNGFADGTTATAGIAIGDGVSGNSISGNQIGTEVTGASAIPNKGPGILIMGSQTNVVNNLVSGNGQAGILIAKLAGNISTPENNIVQGNKIGTNVTGNAAIPNTGPGISIANGANLNTIGGLIDNNGDPATASNGINRLGNLISGNYRGISIGPGDVGGATAPYQNRIQGNLIGTNAIGTAAIPNIGPNGGTGIFIVNSPQNLIGGFGDDIPLARNVVSGNGTFGIDINGGNSSQNRVSGNYIGTQIDGTSPLPNLGGLGIRMGAHHTIIGGPEPNAGNTVAFNTDGGVFIYQDAGCCNSVDPNSIFANGSKGIGLGCVDTTLPDQEITDVSNCSTLPLPNDPGDGDIGGNNLQNYPEVTNYLIDSNGDLVVSYHVDSTPGSSNYGTTGLHIEIFKADSTGQGEQFLGFDNYTVADHNGALAGTKTVNLGNAVTLGFTVSDNVTASATDADGNTSEFFPAFIQTAAGVSVSGRVTNLDGRPIGRSRLELTSVAGEKRIAITNAFGYYKFEDIGAGSTYALTVMHKHFTFANPTRIISVDDSITDLDFVSEE